MGRSKAGRPDPVVSSGKEFFGTSGGGRWATEQMLKALNAGQEMNPDVLRNAGTLRPYEWVEFDKVVVSEAIIRLRAVADLMARGLTKPIPNAMGKTFLQYDKASDLSAASVSLDGLSRGDDDLVEFTQGSLPLAITHKDFNINLRKLSASRNGAEPLDTMQARMAARKVAEKIEAMYFLGGPTFGGYSTPGLLTETNRNTGGFGGSENWANSGHTGEEILADVLTMIAALQADGFYGPYAIYVDTATGVKLEGDFKANSGLTIKQRLLEITDDVSIQTCDQLTANNVVMVQLTEDVVCLVDGEPIQTIQWDTEGGMNIKFKVMGIQVPLIRSTKAGKSGIYHMS